VACPAVVRPFLDRLCVEVWYVLVRIAVAGKTSSHREGVHLLNYVHFSHVSVTVLTIHAFIYVSCMVEISIVRYFVDTLPLNRNPLFVMLSQLLYIRAVRLGSYVAVHTDRSGRNRSVT
jgi:hypothetical protein